MSLLDKASLIVTPNAYKESKLYSVIPNTTLGDMDVVRATTATRVNSAGLIEVVPRNLFTNSNDFANASWNKQNTSITANSIISPDGTQNASKFIANSTNALHAIYSGAGTYYGDNTFSVYAKKGEYNFLILQDQFSSAFYNTFNIDNGTIVGGTNGTITSVGNDWYRCSVKFTAPAGNVFPTITIAPTSGGASYLGDSTSGGYLYAAQLEQGSSATEYFPTTTRLNIPRIDYTNGSCPSLLVEPQRTNIALYSEQFDNAAWDKFGTALTVTSNNVISPDGTQNADTLNVSNNNNTLYQVRTGTFVGNTYTFSLYAKGSGNFTMNIRLNSSTTTTETKTLTSQWQRFNVTVTNAVPVIAIEFYIDLNTSSTYNIWGAQVEQGSYATSYIPTVASTVTRNADVISKTGISSLIGQTEGTMFVDVDFTHLNKGENEYLMQVWLDGSNRILIYRDTSNLINYYFLKGAESFFFQSSINSNSRHKIAFSYKSGQNSFYIDGIQIETNTNLITPFNLLSNIDLGMNNSGGEFSNIGDYHYNSVQFYKTRLSNTELAQLTTL